MNKKQMAQFYLDMELGELVKYESFPISLEMILSKDPKCTLRVYLKSKFTSNFTKNYKAFNSLTEWLIMKEILVIND